MKAIITAHPCSMDFSHKKCHIIIKYSDKENINFFQDSSGVKASSQVTMMVAWL